MNIKEFEKLGNIYTQICELENLLDIYDKNRVLDISVGYLDLESHSVRTKYRLRDKIINVIKRELTLLREELKAGLKEDSNK